jgi:cytochrome bd ubiquinol oxidase subunit II
MVMLWFALAAVMVAGYAVLDGFDFGAGALHGLVARDDRERRQVLAAIGPYWDGNEVWLLAGGGVLFLAFPKVLAAGFSGFYLAVFLLIWTLILRGIALEFRSHVADALWREFWDGVFALASALAPVLLGAALGNVLRGVPLDDDGWFALPLFDSFSPTGALGLLDWYTVGCAVTALAAIAHHGALFLAWKTDGAVHARSRAWAARLFPIVVGLWLAATVATFALCPHVPRGLAVRPLAWFASALLLAGLVTSALARRRERDLLAFLGSVAFLLGVLGATAASVYPVWLPSRPDPSHALTAEATAAAPESLRAGLLWWPFGLVLALGYLALLFRLHRGKAQAAPDGQGY